MLKVNETKPKENKAKHLFIATEQKMAEIGPERENYSDGRSSMEI